MFMIIVGMIPASVIMFMIIAGMIPAVIMHIYCFGLGLIWHLLISCPLAALAESVCLKLRGYSALKGMKDFSIQVTAVIYCLAIPPYGNCQTVFRRARPEHLQSGHGSLYSTADFSTDCHEQLEYP